MSLAVAGRYAYVVNEGANTLQVFDLGGAYIQQFEAGTMVTGTLQTHDTVTVGNNLDVSGGLTVSAGAQISGGLGVINGNVGIGTSSEDYTLYVNGTSAGTSAFQNLSDARYKTNIVTLTHALDKITALRGVRYDWRAEEYPQWHFEQGAQLGFIAQEVKDVLPEVVSQDAQGYYSMAYTKLIPVLVQAVKEQQEQLQEKEMEVRDLKARLERLEDRLGAGNGGARRAVSPPR
jgi:hypothetical protein